MPATVATSLRLKRSDAIVMTVTDSVWCAKPARLSSATATYGLLHGADERHAHHHQRADRERRAPRVDQTHAGVLLQRDADRAAEHAAEVGRQERQPREHRNLLQIESAHRRQIERQPERQRAPRRIGEEPRNRDAPEVPLPRMRRNRRLPFPGEVRFLARAGCSRAPPARAPCAWTAIDRTAATARPTRGQSAPVSTNANCQLCVRIAHATSGAASIEPSDAPMLKNPPARPRSVAGKPLGRRLHAGRVGRAFGEPEERAQAEERLPAARPGRAPC